MIDMSPPPEEAPIIPERKATIKTQGKLKTRPSGTPADLEAMRAQRRHVSHEVPPIPDQYRTETSAQADEQVSSDEDEDEEESHSSGSLSETDMTGQEPQQDEMDAAHDTEKSLQNDTNLDKDVQLADNGTSDMLSEQDEHRQQTREMKLDLDFPLASSDNDMGLGMDAEFDRVIEAQKVGIDTLYRSQTHMLTTIQKGYLMRQNTKVIVASNRNFSDESQRPLSPNGQANPSTTSKSKRTSRKSSAGEKYLTTEPWNGKTRRKSSRRSSGRKSNIGGPAPPLPGHESSLGKVDEYLTTDETNDGEERGRLFVKVVGVKELDLPLPRSKCLYLKLCRIELTLSRR